MALGERLFHSISPACNACHLVAPEVNMAGRSLAGVASCAEKTIASPDYEGKAKDVDGYIRESIMNPSASRAGCHVFGQRRFVYAERVWQGPQARVDESARRLSDEPEIITGNMRYQSRCHAAFYGAYAMIVLAMISYALPILSPQRREDCCPARRDMAITLLIDIRGSTDGWVSGNRRVIDVEREALLLVCIALQGMNKHARCSGEGVQRVTMKTVKEFGEPYSDVISRRIASLDPDLYTRAGAAIRHASGMLMTQTVRHRLLLLQCLLSDGKRNDIDECDGRYGAEDMRQAVSEARPQGIIRSASLSTDRRRTICQRGSARMAMPCFPKPERSQPFCSSG